MPELLDQLTQVELVDQEYGEVQFFVYQLLKRTLSSIDNVEIYRLWLWFSKLKFGSSYGGHHKSFIKDWLGANQQYVIPLFNIALRERNDLTSIWGFWNNFQQLVGVEFDYDQIIDSAFSIIAEKYYCDEKDQLIFELALSLTVMRTTNLESFELLFDYGGSHPELVDVLVRSCQSEVHDWKWKDINRKIDSKKNNKIANK